MLRTFQAPLVYCHFDQLYKTRGAKILFVMARLRRIKGLNFQTDDAFSIVRNIFFRRNYTLSIQNVIGHGTVVRN